MMNVSVGSRSIGMQRLKGRGRVFVVLALVAACVASVFAVTAHAAAKPYKVWVILPLTSSTTNFPDVVEGAKAAATSINKKGGLNGAPIELHFCDTVQTLSGSQNCARQAVDGGADDVFGLNAFDTAARAILTPAGIPGISGIISASQRDALSYPLVPPSIAGAIAATYTVFSKKLCTHMAFTSTDLTATRINEQGVRTAARLFKKGLYAGPIWHPLVVSDYAPYIQKLKQENADCNYDQNSGPGTIAEWNQAQQLGYKPKRWIQTALNFTLQSADKVPDNANGVILSTAVPYPDPSSKAAYQKQYFADMAAAGHNATDVNTIGGVGGMSGWLHIQGLKALSTKVKGAATKASMLNAARKGKNINVEGLFKWSPGKPGPSAYKSSSSGVEYIYELHNLKPRLLATVDAWALLGRK
jgi:ABC-type branched-subunit amino acid transport system substrate-binding protein